MGNIDWLPIEEARKDAAPVLLWGGMPDINSDEIYQDFNEDSDELAASWPAQRPVTGWWDGKQWRYCSYDGGYYGAYENPTHWAEINPPGEVDKAREDYEVLTPGIPIHPTALVEKGIPGLATIQDATDDVLGKDGE